MLTDGDERFGSTDPAILVGVVPQCLHQSREEADVGVGPLVVLVVLLAGEVRLRVEKVEPVPVAEELPAHLIAHAADRKRPEDGVFLLVPAGGSGRKALDEVRPRPQVGERHRLVVLRQLLPAVRSRAEERFGKRAELHEEVRPRFGDDGELGCSPLAAVPEAGEPVFVVHLPWEVDEPGTHGRGKRHRIGAQFRRVARTHDDRGCGHHVLTDPSLGQDGEQAALRGRRHVGHLVHEDESLAVFGLVPQ